MSLVASSQQLVASLYYLEKNHNMDLNFNWNEILLGEEEWSYLWQVILKTVIMFIVVIIALRLIGRRGIMQGVFQVLTIIMLGSSAGDPMLYSKVGLLPAILIFAVTVLLYKITSLAIGKNYEAEKVVEGKPVRFIKDNQFDLANFRSKELDKDEVFADLRKEGVSQIGQVKVAYLEPGGEVSVFFREDDDIKYGLPILPEIYEQHHKEITKPGYYSCSFCGHTLHLSPRKEFKCPSCEKKEWIESSNEKRVT